MITAGIATIYSRAKILPMVINGLLPQVDRVNLYLSGAYPIPPDFGPRVRIFSGDKTDEGKFHRVPKKGIYISCDDDFNFPPDYVEKMASGVKEHGCIVTLHGSNIIWPFRSYYRSRQNFHWNADLNFPQVVDIPGTGVMAFDCSYFRPGKFEERFMADIEIAIMAQKSNKKIVTLPHKRGWLKTYPHKVAETIFATQRNKDQRQSELIRLHQIGKNGVCDFSKRNT